jgi:hypothetical protein
MIFESGTVAFQQPHLPNRFKREGQPPGPPTGGSRRIRPPADTLTQAGTHPTTGCTTLWPLSPVRPILEVRADAFPQRHLTDRSTCHSQPQGPPTGGSRHVRPRRTHTQMGTHRPKRGQTTTADTPQQRAPRWGHSIRVSGLAGVVFPPHGGVLTDIALPAGTHQSQRVSLWDIEVHIGRRYNEGAWWFC